MQNLVLLYFSLTRRDTSLIFKIDYHVRARFIRNHSILASRKRGGKGKEESRLIRPCESYFTLPPHQTWLARNCSRAALGSSRVNFKYTLSIGYTGKIVRSRRVFDKLGPAGSVCAPGQATLHPLRPLYTGRTSTNNVSPRPSFPLRYIRVVGGNATTSIFADQSSEFYQHFSIVSIQLRDY